jgi:hypothetical protein
MLWTDASSILSTHNFTKEEHKTLICTMRGKSQIAMLPNTPDKLDTFGSESSELISFSLVCLCSLQGVVCIGKISWSRITTSKEVAQENFLRLSVAKVTKAPWRFFTRASVGNTLSQELSPRASDFVIWAQLLDLRKDWRVNLLVYKVLGDGTRWKLLH